MKTFCLSISAFLLLSLPAFGDVNLISPANGSTLSSPVHFTANASSSTCSAGVAAMGVYVNDQLAYQVNASSLDMQLSLTPGDYRTVVVEWDNCGGATTASANIVVPGFVSGVTVNSPANNSTVTSPVTFSATAASATCGQGIAAMGIYVDDSLQYSVSAATLNTQLSLSTGAHRTVVQAWDYCGGATATPINLTVAPPATTVVTLTSSPASVTSGSPSVLTVNASYATSVVVTGSDGSSYTLPSSGGTQSVTPTGTTTYTATATSQSGTKVTAATTVTVIPATSLQAVNHVVFMLQENHSFDNYFGMLNPYRIKNKLNIGADGNTYNVDGIDDKLNLITNQSDEGSVYAPFKLASSCVEDLTSSWLESYGDVSRYDFSPTRALNIDGFVHTAENFAKNCAASNGAHCSGTFTDFNGKRAMGYYDEGFLNYYYYMASQFAVSDRWFSPVSSKSIPNRIATFTGGTTQGLAFDPGSDDHLSQLDIPTIFEKLDQSKVSWKIYYTVTQGSCLDQEDCVGQSAGAKYPATNFGYFSYSYQYLYGNPNGAACVAPTQPSSVVGDTTNSFCIDPNHIAPLSSYYTDLANGTLPSFSFIEAGYGRNDEHPGSGQPILLGQQQVANVVNAFMTSPSWKDSIFFLSYDEGGGPYDHVPPVQGHSNDKTTSALGSTSVANIPDISTISVNADSFNPCTSPVGAPTIHCDLPSSNDPGAHSTDAAAIQGYAAQLGFRVPNLVISPFTRKHFVSHTPMDHTAILKFVENRFIGASAHLTARDNAQPNLLEFFDFNSTPWATPPTPPTPVSNQSLGYDACTPQTF
jgi:phospholipase C